MNAENIVPVKNGRSDLAAEHFTQAGNTAGHLCSLDRSVSFWILNWCATLSYLAPLCSRRDTHTLAIHLYLVFFERCLRDRIVRVVLIHQGFQVLLGFLV